ncbi:MAG: methylmalonyl-CoA epimerase [bacterium]|nr:methylmalonyl-CoA epimerase [bacterium]
MFPIDHIGIAVKDLEAEIKAYEKNFACKLDLQEEIPSQKVKLAFLKSENTLIELLTPTSEDSTLAKFIKTKGPGLHHICFRVPDICTELARLKSLGHKLIDEIPRTGAHNSLIAFIHPKSTSGTLIELCQRSPSL